MAKNHIPVDPSFRSLATVGCLGVDENQLALKRELLLTFLDASVPLEIIELWRRGGPSQADWDWLQHADCEDPGGLLSPLPDRCDLSNAHGMGVYLAYVGESMLHRDPGVTRQTFKWVSRCIAIASFYHGGFKVFGRLWSAEEYQHFGGDRQ